MSEQQLDLNTILSRKQQQLDDIVNVDEDTVKLVIFVLGNDWFAFYGERIKEILSNCEVFFLPGCPPTLEGVMNVRGDIESILSLRRVLHYPDGLDNMSTRILLAQGETIRSGIRVDRVEEVVDVVKSAILPPPHTIPEHLRPLVLGNLDFAGQMVSILDIERLFADYCAGTL